jgi:hypothetical protein
MYCSIRVQYGMVDNGWTVQRGVPYTGSSPTQIQFRFEINLAADEKIMFANIWVSPDTGLICRMVLMSSKATYGYIGDGLSTSGLYYYLPRGLAFFGGKDAGIAESAPWISTRYVIELGLLE